MIVPSRSRSGHANSGQTGTGEVNDSPPAAALLRALAAHRAGKLYAAETLYRKILSRTPNHADALHLLGTLLIDKGRITQAIDLIHKAISLLPNFPQAYNNLGNALRLGGRNREAEEAYLQALTLQPYFAIAWNNLGRLYNDEARFDSAAEACRQAIMHDPTLAESHYNLGIAYRALGQSACAVNCYREAVRLKHDDVSMVAGFAMLLLELDRRTEANELLLQARTHRPDDPHLCLALAAVNRYDGRVAEAIRLLRHVVDRLPTCAEGWSSLGGALCAVGQFAEAAACCEQAIALDPGLASAYRRLVQTSQNSNRQSEISRLSGLLDTERLGLSDRINFAFALGKMLDDAGHYDEAFARFEMGNNLVALLLKQSDRAFDQASLDNVVDRLIEDGSNSVAGMSLPHESPIPVFVVGMPRSGTSLIEQIIASHSNAAGIGESADIGAVADRLAGQIACSEVRNGAARWYLARLQAAAPGKNRVVDKMPDNIFHLGLISALFPNAKIVMVRRNPMDTGLSCYFHHFSNHKQSFSYNIEDCAYRQLAVERLITHWRAILPESIIEIHYEKVITHPEHETRRLIDFLDLRWEDACLDFHKTERTVTTPSSWQVRQPLYRSSVGRWLHYRHHLGPMIDVLAKGNPAWANDLNAPQR